MKIMQKEINNILYKEKGGLLNDILGDTLCFHGTRNKFPTGNRKTLSNRH